MRSRRWLLATVGFLAPLLAWAPSIPALAAAAGCRSGRIVFTSDRGGPQPDLYVMDAHGNDPTRITTTGAHGPNWSPDGSRIVFDGFTEAGAHDIFTVRADGSDLTDLTNSAPGLTQYDPAWSADGTEIAFAAEPVGTRHAALYVMNGDGSGRHEVANVAGAEEEHPSWSPDGTLIAFDAFPAAGPDHIYLVRPDGTHLRGLTSDALDAWGPDWSPKGNLIAFSDGGSAPVSDLMTIRPDGAGLTQLTHLGMFTAAGLAAFSPDGRAITYSLFRPRHLPDVFRMSITGSDVHNLTKDVVAFDYWSDWGPCPA